MVNTPMLAATESTLSPSEIQVIRSERKSKIPIGRIGEPSDVASTVVFLATSESSWTTGSVFVIDGGYLAGR
jgi:NAD(P)-dependent dehydrogenase (short-subunit alcohol dehydrogenase family)